MNLYEFLSRYHILALILNPTLHHILRHFSRCKLLFRELFHIWTVQNMCFHSGIFQTLCHLVSHGPKSLRIVFRLGTSLLLYHVSFCRSRSQHILNLWIWVLSIQLLAVLILNLLQPIPILYHQTSKARFICFVFPFGLLDAVQWLHMMHCYSFFLVCPECIRRLNATVIYSEFWPSFHYNF